MSVADQSIAEVGMLPISKAATVETTVHFHARSLFAQFGQPENNNKTRAIVDIALSGISCDMYDRIEAAAVDMAKKADELAGFKASDDAKGTAKYGPKQQSMRVQASMRRQIFGVARLNLGALVNIPASGIVNPDTYPGFVEATNKARAYLKEHNIDWQGQNTEDKRRQQQQKRETGLWKQARDTAEQQVKQEPGENIAQWQARVVEHAQDLLAEMEDKAKQEALQKVAKNLMLEYGVNGCMDLADLLLALCKEQA